MSEEQQPLTKPGRKPADGERYPSGKLKTPAKFAGTPPAQIKKMIDLARAKAADPVLATPLGWLRLHDKLTTRHLAAAVSYATLRGRFHRAMGFRPRSAASPSYDAGYGSQPQPEDERRVLRIREDHGAMLAMIGASEMVILDEACIDDRYQADFELPRLRALLDRLATHFGLTR